MLQQTRIKVGSRFEQIIENETMLLQDSTGDICSLESIHSPSVSLVLEATPCYHHLLYFCEVSPIPQKGFVGDPRRS